MESPSLRGIIQFDSGRRVAVPSKASQSIAHFDLCSDNAGITFECATWMKYRRNARQVHRSVIDFHFVFSDHRRGRRMTASGVDP